jgi:hypothetical protein
MSSPWENSTSPVPPLTDAEQVVTVDVALDIAERMMPHLAGQNGITVSIVLAELTSLWLAGMHPNLRQECWNHYAKLTQQLVAPNEKKIFGDAGHPGRSLDKDDA